jgi:RNA polymerase sigma-70 factor (ECF subfamily)
LPLSVAEFLAAEEPSGDVPPDERQALHLALRRLPVAFQTALALYYLEGVSYEEIARQMGVTAAGARTRVHRARLMLARHLRRMGVAR